MTLVIIGLGVVGLALLARKKSKRPARWVKDGKPRFTPEFYADLKALIYRLGMEDGHLAGTIK